MDGSDVSVVETWLCALTDCEMGNFVDIYSYELNEESPLKIEVLPLNNCLQTLILKFLVASTTIPAGTDYSK